MTLNVTYLSLRVAEVTVPNDLIRLGCEFRNPKTFAVGRHARLERATKVGLGLLSIHNKV